MGVVRVVAAAMLCAVAAHAGSDQAVGRVATPAVKLTDLENRTIDPFEASAGAKAMVFLFVSTECPISNRYAPEINRLHDRFVSRGAAFWLVYPNPADSSLEIRRHIDAYSYPGRPLRDPQHAMVRAAKVTVTPEAAIFDAHGRLRYRGRIDDRYVSFGVSRREPTTRDLETALEAVLAMKPVPQPVTRAVGCFLADFRP